MDSVFQLKESSGQPGSKKLSMIYPQQLRGSGGAVAMVNIPMVIHLRSPFQDPIAKYSKSIVGIYVY